MEPIIKCSAGLDIHKELIVVTLLKELENGEISNTVKEFTTYPESLKQLAKWLLLEKVDLAVMESTGVFWLRHDVINESCLRRKVGDHLYHQVNLGA